MFGEWEFEANLIWENVYLGGLDSAYDEAGLKTHGITHILQIEDYFDPKFTANYEYLVIRIADTGTSSLLTVLDETRKFINQGRKEGTNVSFPPIQPFLPTRTVLNHPLVPVSPY